MRSPRFSAEIHRRAAAYLPRQSLQVDFYRIRQRLAIGLPLLALPKALSSVREFSGYPYAVWVLWELEERILSLGWEVEMTGCQTAQAAVLRDLKGLHAWNFTSGDAPGLWSSHLVRILVTTLHWDWVDRELRLELEATLGRLVDHMAEAGSPTEPSNQIQFANIAIITNLGWAIGAWKVGHPSARTARTLAIAKLEVWLEKGLEGHSEGVCYDGYVADFVMDFVRACLASADQARLLGHERLRAIMESLAALGTPARPENLAPLGDIEPEQMPFHYSFALKFLATHPENIPFEPPWQMGRLLRCDALPYFPEDGRLPRRRRAAGTGPKDAHYAIVWNFGPRKLQAKAVVAWSNSSMNHLHCDAGHLIIAAGGKWIITDPGYQQYLQTSERNFTLGPCAHNQPVINGYQATQKPESRKFTRSGADSDFDLSATYPVESGLRSVHRSLRMEGQKIIVRDLVEADSLESIAYSWHAHPEAFLRVERGQGVIVLENYRLDLFCQEHPFVPTDICRLRGSRGSLTLQKMIAFSSGARVTEVVWEFDLSKE